MIFYHIEIPSKGVDQTIPITDEGLAGIAAAATSIFSDRDSQFRITDQAGRQVNLDAILAQDGSIVADGEAAFETAPTGDWLNEIKNNIKTYGAGDGTGKVTKQFTAKLGGTDGTHIVQFDHPDFFRGLVQMYQAAGLKPVDEIVFLHQGNDAMNIAQKIAQFGGNKKHRHHYQRGGHKKTLTNKQLAALAYGREVRRKNLAAQKGGYYY
jgi:hypothetical protein